MNDVITWTKQEILHDKMNNEQIYHVWEGYLRKIPSLSIVQPTLIINHSTQWQWGSRRLF
jgi:hypothetical protein